jgi:hypothetical protein
VPFPFKTTDTVFGVVKTFLSCASVGCASDSPAFKNRTKTASDKM